MRVMLSEKIKKFFVFSGFKYGFQKKSIGDYRATDLCENKLQIFF